jgi:nitrous oxide reductase accessory protein NosL
VKRLLDPILLAVVLCIPVLGCEPAVTDGPPSIRLGQDLCAHCGMIITDARSAAGSIVEVDGQRSRVLFDDIGDMIDYHARPDAEPVLRRYVTDFKTRQWVTFEQAHLVHAPAVHTPMGSGLLAFTLSQDAQAAAREHPGRVLTPDEAVALRQGPATPVQE